jgi:hypothetical protein
MKYLMALLLIAGIALAGSDGEWFPWGNLAGVGILAAVAVLAGRQEARTR